MIVSGKFEDKKIEETTMNHIGRHLTEPTEAENFHRQENMLKLMIETSEAWLVEYIVQSLKEYDSNHFFFCALCRCDFERGLFSKLAHIMGGESDPERLTIENARFLVQSVSRIGQEKRLLNLHPEVWIGRDGPFLYAFNVILFDLEEILGGRRLDETLHGTWAGDLLDVLRKRRKAYEAFYSERAVKEQERKANYSEEVSRSRAEKRALRAAAHALRLEKKKERDRLWHERQSQQ